MKRAAVYFVAFISGWLLGGCRSDDSQDPIPPVPKPKPISFTVINADSTDLLPQYILEPDNRLDGEFQLEANYFIRQGDYQFTLAENNFWATYEGTPVYDNRVNEYQMCSNSYNNCDSVQYQPASIWERLGSVSSSQRLVWQYVTTARDQGYRLEMTHLPQPVLIPQWPTVLSTTTDNVIGFRRQSAQDSVRFELLYVSKSVLNQVRTVPSLNYERAWFPNVVGPDRIILPAKELARSIDYFHSPTAADTVFINVASLRRVIKIVAGKKMQLTYQLNHLMPVTIQ